MDSSIDSALRCINELTSFISFEKLEGLDSHRSSIFHDLAIGRAFALVSAWQPAASNVDNDNNTAALLVDLHRLGLKTIQLLGHLEPPGTVSDIIPHRAFYIRYPNSMSKTFKQQMLSLCLKYDQPGVALYEHREIRVFDANGKVLSCFPLSTIKPKTLRKIWNSVADREFSYLESGYLDGNPRWICSYSYNSVGLTSDLSDQIGLSPDLIRYRPFRSKEEIERSNRNDISRRSEELAAALFLARQAGDQAKLETCRNELNDFCQKYDFSADTLIENDLFNRASSLAVLWFLKLKSKRSEKAALSYEKLRQFCLEQELNIDTVISDTKAKHPAWADEDDNL